ncbi:MAG: hypothetical protein ACOVN7_14110 [Rubrivivax sp.]
MQTRRGKIAQVVESADEWLGSVNLFSTPEVAAGVVRGKTVQNRKRTDLRVFLEAPMADQPADRKIRSFPDDLGACMEKTVPQVWCKRAVRGSRPPNLAAASRRYTLAPGDDDHRSENAHEACAVGRAGSAVAPVIDRSRCTARHPENVPGLGGFKSEVQHLAHPVGCADDQKIPADAS